MFKAIENNEGQFKVKEFDAEGNSVQVFEEVFDTEAEANEFISAKGGTVAVPVEVAAPEVAEEAAAPEAAPEVAEEAKNEAAPENESAHVE